MELRSPLDKIRIVRCHREILKTRSKAESHESPATIPLHETTVKKNLL